MPHGIGYDNNSMILRNETAITDYSCMAYHRAD